MRRAEALRLLPAEGNEPVMGVNSTPPQVAPNLATGLRIQSLTGISLAVLALLAGPVAAYSTLAGSLAVYLPGLLFTLMVARRMGGDSAGFLRTVALAEFVKLALTGVLCGLAFVFVKPLAAGFFFIGMIGVLIASWLGLALSFRGM
jgi:F0F1-type ATP synthase assembly protein I